MATKKKKAKDKDPTLYGVQECRMTDGEKDDLLAHLLALPAFFHEAIPHLTHPVVKDQDEKFNFVVDACRLLHESGLTPATKSFRRKVKNRMRRTAKDQEVPEWIELVDELVEKGGFVDEAFEADDLDADHARSLLRRFLAEATVLLPLGDLLQNCQSFSTVPADLPGVIEEVRGRLQSMGSIGTKPARTVEEEWKDHKARMAKQRGKALLGLRTGLQGLDKRTVGLRGLVVLGSQPGAGKTSFSAVQVAAGVCRHHAENDAVVVVVSLDMDRFDIYRRLHCHLAGMDWVPLMFGSIKEERALGSMFSKAHSACLKKAEKRLEADQVGRRYAVLDREVLGEEFSPAGLAEVVASLKKKAGASRALVIIDYAQLLPVPEDLEGSDLAADKYRVRFAQQVVEGTRTAKDPVGDTVLLISEARKPTTKKEGWGDSMADLMGSARLSYAADAVLLYRPMHPRELEEYYGVKGGPAVEKRRAALREQGVAPVMLTLEKGRDGMTRGSWALEFLFRQSTFREIQPAGKQLPCPPCAAPGGPGTQPPLPPPPPLAVGQKKKKAASEQGAAAASPSGKVGAKKVK